MSSINSDRSSLRHGGRRKLRDDADAADVSLEEARLSARPHLRRRVSQSQRVWKIAEVARRGTVRPESIREVDSLRQASGVPHGGAGADDEARLDEPVEPSISGGESGRGEEVRRERVTETGHTRSPCFLNDH